jgi:hypothetical protein
MDFLLLSHVLDGMREDQLYPFPSGQGRVIRPDFIIHA